MDNIFIIIFEDNETFKGGTDLYETKWNDIPDKNIRTLFYRLPSGDYIALNNYQQYFHVIEATQDIHGSNENKIEYAYIMGRLEETVTVYKIDLYNKIGNVEIKYYDIDDEYIKKLNPTIWKKGLI